MDIEGLIAGPIEDWDLEILERVASTGIQETQKLEFKADFALGNEEIWRTRQERISPRSRDALAEEIVGFANAFGGMLLLGVCEKTQEDGINVSAGLSHAVPSVLSCSDRLEQALRAVIDPPLPMLELRPLTADADGGGYIIIKVPKSLSAPHGVGRPARAFVRRGARCEPMTMRDLQHVFWETRTAIDRVNSIFLDRRKLFDEGAMKKPPEGAGPRVCFRFTVVPAFSYDIAAIPRLVDPGQFRFANVPYVSRSQRTSLSFIPRWEPIADGVEAIDDGLGDYLENCLQIWGDGTIQQTGVYVSGDPEGRRRHPPKLYATGAIWLLYNAMRLRRHVGRVDTPLIIEVELDASTTDGVIYYSGGNYEHASAAAPREPVITKRLEFRHDNEFDDISQRLAQQIAWACGLDLDCSDLMVDLGQA